MDKLAIGLVAVLVAGVLLVGLSFAQLFSAPLPKNTTQNYQQFKSAELSDKCATPSGYTDAQWREHMGHHPDQYAECLK